jgi:general secretion pathway protein F
MKFAYEAFDASGKKLRGVSESTSQTDAVEQLRRQGLFVSSITEARADAVNGSSNHTTSGKKLRMGKGRRLKNMAMFTRQLAVLVASGVQLCEALGALERQSKDKAWRELVAGLRQKVEEGVPLSEAMAHYPDTFDAVARSLIAAGEAGGIFDTMLDRLATLTKSRFRSARPSSARWSIRRC